MTLGSAGYDERWPLFVLPSIEELGLRYGDLLAMTLDDLSTALILGGNAVRGRPKPGARRG